MQQKRSNDPPVLHSFICTDLYNYETFIALFIHSLNYVDFSQLPV